MRRRLLSNKDRHKNRSSRGFTLVEILVAIVIGSAISACLIDTFSQLLRATSKSQSEIYADSVSQEMMQIFRSMDYDTLKLQVGGPYNLVLNGDQALQPAPYIKPEPALLDFNNRIWYPQTRKKSFTGTATYTIENGSIPNSLNVSLTVAWPNGNGGSPAKSVTSSTIITRSGLDRWRQ